MWKQRISRGGDSMGDTEFLAHHGVKGQKWGVRRYRRNSASGISTVKRNMANNHIDYTKAHSKKSVKNMSDSELRSRLNRLQMEQNYEKLSTKDVSRGQRFVKKAMKTATTVATVTTTGLTIYNNVDRIRKIANGYKK